MLLSSIDLRYIHLSIPHFTGTSLLFRVIKFASLQASKQRTADPLTFSFSPLVSFRRTNYHSIFCNTVYTCMYIMCCLQTLLNADAGYLNSWHVSLQCRIKSLMEIRIFRSQYTLSSGNSFRC